MNPARIWKAGSEVLVNFVLPFSIFVVMHERFGDVHALIASSVPPILWSVAEFLRHRRLDALSALVLLGIALSLLALLGGGSVRLLQLREKLVTVFVGAVFLGSAIVRKPLMYPIVRAFLARRNDADLERVDALRDDAQFKRGMTVMTVVWGVGLLADAAISIALVFVLSIQTYLIVNPILGYATIGSLTLWNIWFGRRLRQRRDARTTISASAKPVEIAPASVSGPK